MVLDVVSEPLEDISVGQTLKRISLTEHVAEVQTQIIQEDQSPIFGPGLEKDTFQESVPKVITEQSNFLSFH